MRTIVFRLADQATWSAAFFMANIWAAFALSINDFAASTIGSSVGVIAAAVVRAYSVDARLISSSRHNHTGTEWLSTRVVIKSTLVGSVAAALTTLTWFAMGGTLVQHWQYCLLAFLIVAADLPHYSLIILGRQTPAVCLSGIYAIVIGLTWLINPSRPIESWIGALATVAVFGWIVLGRSSSGIAPELSKGTSNRMAAEALYAALAGQLGILILYLVAASDATAGIRLSYSLVFSPVFLIIQGLFPLLLRRVTNTQWKNAIRVRRILLLWVIGSSSALSLVAFGAWITSGTGLGFASTISLTIPFLLPVGASMVGNLILDAGLLRWRLVSLPSGPHRVRLILTLIDLLLQVSLVLILSMNGLIWALIFGGILKCFAGVFLLLRRDNKLLESNSNK